MSARGVGALVVGGALALVAVGAGLWLVFGSGTSRQAHAQEGPDMSETAKTVAEKLRAELEKTGQYKGLEIKTDAIAAPGSLTIVRAFASGAYPGTGASTVLLDADGTTYGKRGAKDFADLVRARGWLEKSPPAADLAKLVNAALYDYVIAIDDAEPPVIVNARGALTLRFVRRSFPSGARETIRVIVESSGPARVEADQE